MMAVQPALAHALHLIGFLQQLRDGEREVLEEHFVHHQVIPEHLGFPLPPGDRASSEK